MTGAAAGGAGPQPQGEGPVAALDPGSAKCGLVLSDGARQRIVQALVVAPAEAERLLELWRQEPGLAAVVIGDGTGSGRWRERLAGRLPVVWQRERGSTLAARERYWQLFPPPQLAALAAQGVAPAPARLGRRGSPAAAGALAGQGAGARTGDRAGGRGANDQNEARTAKA